MPKQNKFKAAVASAAGTTADNVNILDITEERRRAGSVFVETKVLALVVDCYIDELFFQH